MKKKQFKQLAYLGLVTGCLLSAENVHAEAHTNVDSTVMLAHASCGGGSCGGSSQPPQGNYQSQKQRPSSYYVSEGEVPNSQEIPRPQNPGSGNPSNPSNPSNPQGGNPGQQGHPGAQNGYQNQNPYSRGYLLAGCKCGKTEDKTNAVAQKILACECDQIHEEIV